MMHSYSGSVPLEAAAGVFFVAEGLRPCIAYLDLNKVLIKNKHFLFFPCVS